MISLLGVELHYHTRRIKMEKWTCVVCGYVYDPAKGDPEHGVPAGTSFEKIPADWTCPECGAAKSDFEKNA
jgi:rubredoxin